jgi:pilus assembly protein CpaF
MTTETMANPFDLILPFVPELAPYILDPEISEICLNSNGTVYVERRGVMERIGRDILEPKKLMFAVQRIARQAGEEIDDARPYVDARLPDGSRVAAVIPPCSVDGPIVTIRKFQRQYFGLARLVELGTLSRETADLLRGALAGRQNILISGQPGSGKTSLQNALLNELDPHQDRIVVIEESAEMQIEAENVARLECRTTPGLPPVTIRDLVKIALRHRPDHLVIGEVRGAEAMDLLDALNTGNSGSMTTIHANSTLAALTKLSNLALRASADIPHAAIQAQIADVIAYVVQMERRGDTRRVSEVIRLRGYDFNARLFVSDPVYPKPTVTKGNAN